MHIFQKLWQETKCEPKKILFGFAFGIVIFLTYQLPCWSENIELGITGYKVLQHIIYWLLFATITINFPVVIMMGMVNSVFMLAIPIFWALSLPFFLNIFRDKNWEWGIWIGLYLAAGAATATIFTGAFFLPCG